MISALLIAITRNINFVSAFRYEERNATDMPSAITSYTVDGKKKTVKHYHGDMNAPKELNELEDRIDEIINTDQWVK